MSARNMRSFKLPAAACHAVGHDEPVTVRAAVGVVPNVRAGNSGLLYRRLNPTDGNE